MLPTKKTSTSVETMPMQERRDLDLESARCRAERTRARSLGLKGQLFDPHDEDQEAETAWSAEKRSSRPGRVPVDTSGARAQSLRAHPGSAMPRRRLYSRTAPKWFPRGTRSRGTSRGAGQFSRRVSFPRRPGEPSECRRRRAASRSRARRSHRARGSCAARSAGMPIGSSEDACSARAAHKNWAPVQVGPRYQKPVGRSARARQGRASSNGQDGSIAAGSACAWPGHAARHPRASVRAPRREAQQHHRGPARVRRRVRRPRALGHRPRASRRSRKPKRREWLAAAEGRARGGRAA